MSNFLEALQKKIDSSLSNNYGKENYDEYRFGKFVAPNIPKPGFLQKIKSLIIPKPTPFFNLAEHPLVINYANGLSYIYEQIDQESKELLVDLTAYRMLGFTKVKLPLSNNCYWDLFETAKSLMNEKDTIDPKFMHFMLKRFHLKPIGYNIDFYFTEAGVVTDFMLEQYACKRNNQYVLQAEAGDIVLDVGGCWGDTALYFSDKVSNTGKVFSFEFIPGNIKIHNKNTSLNPQLKEQISLIQHPVSDVSGQKIYYADYGPGSKIAFSPFEEQTGSTTTLSIDDFVTQNNISRIDFIKMDIEGAEPIALKGAIETIKKYKPKLAIAIYHSMDDFVNIPRWLMDLNLGYKFYIGHYKIHAEETILFAKP